MKIPLQPTAQTRPVPIKTVTFHDEGYLGVLFWGMKLAGVKKKKKKSKRNQGIDFQIENVYAGIDRWQ